MIQRLKKWLFGWWDAKQYLIVALPKNKGAIVYQHEDGVLILFEESD